MIGMTSPATQSPASIPRRRSHRGMLVCAAMFVLGGAVLWGLFQAPRNRAPVAPALPWGTPARPLRFVSLEVGGQPGISDALVRQVRGLDPDYVLVQNVRYDDALPLAEALGMAKHFHPSQFQRADRRAKDGPGDLLLSLHLLYDAGRIELDTHVSRPDAFGVRAVAAIDGVRFVVASGVGATDGYRRAHDIERCTAGSPPTVLATGFLRTRRDEGRYDGDLLPVAAPRQEAEGEPGRLIRVAGIYVDPSWVLARDMTVAAADGKGLLIAAELKGAGPATTSPAASGPAR